VGSSVDLGHAIAWLLHLNIGHLEKVMTNMIGNPLILYLECRWIWWNGDDEGNEKNGYAISFCHYLCDKANIIGNGH
jgi:hypothetical protein